MIDYARLADRAKLTQDADRLAVDKQKKQSANPCAFFEQVKVRLIEEMNKANVELHKRRTAALGRNHLPGFDNEIFLTYGTDALCRVGLDVLRGGCRITAVISGPPNGNELSRKEYRCDQEALCSEKPRAEGPELVIAESCPEEIAADIILGILIGRFR